MSMFETSDLAKKIRHALRQSIWLTFVVICWTSSESWARGRFDGGGFGGVVACEAQLCLAGTLQGRSGGFGCTLPERVYFNIREYDALGFFDPITTNITRSAFIDECGDVENAEWAILISEAYGSLYDGP